MVSGDGINLTCCRKITFGVKRRLRYCSIIAREEYSPSLAEHVKCIDLRHPKGLEERRGGGDTTLIFS